MYGHRMWPGSIRGGITAGLIFLAIAGAWGRSAGCVGTSGEAGEGETGHAGDDERERAIRYNRRRELVALVGMACSALLRLLALVTGYSAWLRDRASRVAPRRVGAPMPYTLVGSLLSSLLSLPLAYYGDWVLEQRYGLSNQSRGAWLWERVKGEAIGLVLGLPVIQVVYAIIRRYPRGWWAILSALMIPFTIVLANLAPILILPLFNKYEPIRDRALAERIKALAAAQGVVVSDVLQMDMSKQTTRANAFFTGLGNTKRIVLADTLLSAFTPDEVAVVLAHELGHQVHRDIWKLIGLGAATTALTAWSTERLSAPLLARFGRRLRLDPAAGLADIAALPLLSLLLGLLSLGLRPLQNAVSRNLVERSADRYALDLTSDPAAFIGAMEKLGRMNLADPQPPLLVKWFFHSHPSIEERIAFGRGYAARRGAAS